MQQNFLKTYKRPVVIIVIISLVLLLGTRTVPKYTNYNPRFESNYMNGCESTGAAKSICSCVYSELKRQYSYKQAVQIDVHPTSQFAQATARKLVAECKNN